MRKESSTNAINEKQIKDSCGMAYSLSVLGGRWKPAILCRLMYQTMRYSDLRNSIEQISERMLVSQLRELEADQVVKRTVYPVVPPRVEYELTALGLSMRPMLKAMSDWGNMHRSKVNPDADIVVSEF
ncbi:helix-turn-helix domain-containing protein [Pedobacter sp. PLR]|uniref:winged helix-turn-helix transcriptional regulator n=1 Tax=Pedobacter sp. PLR TaxID=2994465 RepID=UPI002245E28D|nr:helix-turn-helix domain-containing protein [Pedobacter sp. PLR]MCX2449762.1 helix-turn-helix domain-containing protein [Pedobacter sp. PLR]